MSNSYAEQHLILLSAGIASGREDTRDYAVGLARQVQWPVLAERLRARRLLATLGPRILDLTEGAADDSFAAAVENSVTLGRRHGAFLQLIAGRAMTLLADAGIPSAPLKGPFLGERIYGDAGRRRSTDIDLLVSPEQLYPAVEVLRTLGYAAPTDHVKDDGLPLLHFMLVHEGGQLPAVELHWRIHWYEQHFAKTRLLPLGSAPPNTWRPAPAAELAALLLFYARDGFVDLRLATDIGAWWDSFGTDLAPEALDELIADFPAFARVIPVAAMVAEQIVGLPAGELICKKPKLDLRNRMAIRLANPNPTVSQSQLYADMGLIDGLLMPPRSFGDFFTRKVWLPREVFDEYARRAQKWRAKSRVDYSLRVLMRYGLAATRSTRAANKLGQRQSH